MKLSQDEKNEMKYLSGLTVGFPRPMLQEERKRLEFLNAKQWHNECSNPHCNGYEGSNDEMNCPKCGYELLKKLI